MTRALMSITILMLCVKAIPYIAICGNYISVLYFVPLEQIKCRIAKEICYKLQKKRKF